MLAIGGPVSYFGLKESEDHSFNSDSAGVEEQNYHDWYVANFSHLKGRRIKHKDYSLEKELSLKDKRMLDREFRRLAPDVPLLDPKYSSEHQFELLQCSAKVWAQYVQRSQKSIDDILKFVGMSDEKGEIEFNRLTERASPPSTSKVARLTVYKRDYDVHIADYDVDGKAGGLIGRITREIPQSLGHYSPGIDLRMPKDSNDVWQFNGVVHKPLFISLGNDSVEAYTTPISEYVHFLLTESRGKQMRRFLTKKWEGLGKPSSMKSSDIRDVGMKVMTWEEGVLHGIIDEYVVVNQSRLGFDTRELNEYLTHSVSTAKYQYIPLIRNKIQRGASPTDLIHQYRNNPEKLFESANK